MLPVITMSSPGCAFSADLLDGIAEVFTVGTTWTTWTTWTTDAPHRDSRPHPYPPRRRLRNRGDGDGGNHRGHRVRQVRFVQLLYAGDDVSGQTWHNREWTTAQARPPLLELALETVVRLPIRWRQSTAFHGLCELPVLAS
jgi:hypothetical protein